MKKYLLLIVIVIFCIFSSVYTIVVTNKKNKQLFIQLDSKIEKAEIQLINSTERLRKDGFIESPNFSDYSGNVLNSTVLIASSDKLKKFSFEKDKVLVSSEIVIDDLRGLGTGFFINNRGYIVTAKHVVDAIDSGNIAIKLMSNQLYKAVVVKVDDRSDIAILKTDHNNNHFLEIGYFENVSTGDDVGMVGFPLSAGIVSPLVHRGNVSGKGKDNDTNVIIVNAFVVNGNSGGPVFSTKTGRVIGVTSARRSDLSSSQKHIELPPGFQSGFTISNIDPVKLTVDLYNDTLKTVGYVSQVGIGIVRPFDPYFIKEYLIE